MSCLKIRAHLTWIKEWALGLRKTLTVILLLSITSSLLVTGFLTSDSFALIWQAAAPAFFAANFIEHSMNALGKKWENHGD